MCLLAPTCILEVVERSRNACGTLVSFGDVPRKKKPFCFQVAWNMGNGNCIKCVDVLGEIDRSPPTPRGNENTTCGVGNLDEQVSLMCLCRWNELRLSQ